jgi:hypothetical protein
MFQSFGKVHFSRLAKSMKNICIVQNFAPLSFSLTNYKISDQFGAFN